MLYNQSINHYICGYTLLFFFAPSDNFERQKNVLLNWKQMESAIKMINNGSECDFVFLC